MYQSYQYQSEFAFLAVIAFANFSPKTCFTLWSSTMTMRLPFLLYQKISGLSSLFDKFLCSNSTKT
ncbi:hypothetical protein RhiirA4_218542 [Rhizophagus irregularis]|uniref:Uncharacterized protein n=1 Tax=Rhizophagus irregularis TaxID=588596 RepID=A0A2I1HSD6_9GLOM|nr:hypothetical protein RhiirA4_218542 [Rhizophagus irregularis]